MLATAVGGKSCRLGLQDQTAVHGWLPLLLGAAKSGLVQSTLGGRRLWHSAKAAFILTGSCAASTARTAIKRLTILAINLHGAVLEAEGGVGFPRG